VLSFGTITKHVPVVLAVRTVLLVMTDEVNDDSRRQNRHVVFSRDDVDAVGVRQGEQFLRHGRDGSSLARETVFVLPEAAGNFVVVWSRHVERELRLEPSELFDDFGKHLAVSMNLVLRLERLKLLGDECDFFPGVVPLE
jgi:hypothetical protein